MLGLLSHVSDRQIALKLNFKSLKNSWKISKFFLILLMLRWRTVMDSESVLLTNVLVWFTVKYFVSREEILSKKLVPGSSSGLQVCLIVLDFFLCQESGKMFN